MPSAKAEELVARWEALEPWTGPPPEPPQLGYRGAFLTDGAQRSWTAFSGAVRLGDDLRRDDAREIERAVLAEAPPGALPDWVFDPRSEEGGDAGT
jgi:hypothetical protein